MTFNKPPNFGSRFQFPENMHVEYDGLSGTLIDEIVIHMAQKYDDAVVTQIAIEARANGISDLTVLNKGAILMALSRSLPDSPYPDGDRSILACPRCGSGEYLHNEDGNEMHFCGQCGQALDWEV